MDNFIYHNYTEIVFGKGTEQQVGELTAKLGKKVLLHYGGGSIKKFGLYDRVVTALQAAGVDFIELGGVQPNPRLSLVREGISLCRREGVDCVLAVGGGSAIDSAKAIAMGVPYDGDVWDFFGANRKAAPKTVLPIGVVLTIPAAGSETSNNSVITNEDGWMKCGGSSPMVRPQFAILNPELTYTLPFSETANGVADMLAHVLERYFADTEAADFTDRLCEAAMRSILYLGPQVKRDPDNYNIRANLMWAGCSAHGGYLGVGRGTRKGREGDWGSHAIEHPLSAHYGIAHGAGLAIMFPAWMKYVYRAHLPRFVQFAQRVFDVDLPMEDPDAIVLEGIRRLEAFFKQMDLPVRLSEVGIDDAKFVEIAEQIAPVGMFHKLEQEDIIAVYRLAL
ncbi:MAG: iron-containing alcohol dehydrogenase [Oscillospiraceae bacterium]|nr:iron-containing alcohol dehydrogenase [Oscillospiraceae bacterium]